MTQASGASDIEQGEIGNSEIGVALSGGMDCSGEDARLAIGIAGTRMSLAAMKLLWPVFAAPKVRSWVEEHVHAGTVERLEIVTNAPISTLKTSGPPVPEDGLAIKIVGAWCRDQSRSQVFPHPRCRHRRAHHRTHCRHQLGRGNVETSQGRKLSITNGVFEVPDTFPKSPPAKARFRLDGSVPAGAELLATDRLRDFSGTPLDPQPAGVS